MRCLHPKWIDCNAILLALFAFTLQLNAQVSVSGALSGNGSYTSLRLAFNAINAGNQTNSDILITITGNTTETSVAALNSGTWHSLVIKPQGDRVISGNLITALVSLNGADNVLIDGLNAGGNSLTIANSGNSTSWGNCTLLLTNGAVYNTIKNCTLKGNTQSGSMGVVFINAGASAANNHNTITACAITPESAASPPVSGIVIRGTSAMPDTYTTISDNLISDFFSEGAGSSGISTVYAENLAITGNRIFQTTPRNGNTINSLIIHRGINVGASANTGHTISGNIVGYANSLGTGKTIYNSIYQMNFRGIEIAPGTATSGSISVLNNEVAGIETSNNYTGVNFIGLYISSGINYDVRGNIIGSITANNSIVFSSTLTNRYIGGLYVTCSGAATISGNLIGGISTAGSADIAYNINGIQTTGTGNYIVSGNTIGSPSLSNSIVSGTAGVTINNTGTIYGINVAGAGAVATVTNNVIQNMAAYSEKNPQLRPIRVGGGSTVTINGNIIADITTTGTGSVTGIQNVATALNTDISGNLLRKIYVDSGNYYGVTNSGNVTGTVTISGNLFGDDSAPSAIFSGGGAPNIYLINTSSSVIHAALNITGNDFRSIQAPDNAGNYQYFVYNSAQSYIQNISDNTFTNITVNNSKGGVLLRNDVNLPAGSVQTISNNRNVGPMTKTGAGSFYLYFSVYSNAVSTAAAIHSNNNFSNISIPDSAIMYGWYANNNGSAVKQVYGNTFSNWSLGSATNYVLQMNAFGSGSYIRQNTITNIVSLGPFSAIVLGTNGAAGDLHVDHNIFNTISSATGALSIINTYSNSPGIFIHDNQLNSISSTAAGSYAVSPILLSAGTGSCSVYNNILSGITHTGTGSALINGISVTGGTTSLIYANKISNMSLTGTTTTGQVSGINIAGGTNTSVYNNSIGGLTAPNGSNVLSVMGLKISGASTATTCNVYNNTVYLDASSTGINFGTAALYHRASSTADIAKLILKNNILINRSSYTGSGFTAAIWRSNPVLSNYDASSNNNLLYAGTPGTKNLILYNNGNASANDQTIAAFKTRLTPAESNSLTENTTFASLDGANTAFLHIAAGTASLAESNGAAIGGLEADIDGDVRDESFPDIGADEFEGAAPTLSALSIDEFCSTAAGQSVIITGTNLNLIKSVTFAGPSGRLNAPIISQSATTITVTTPAGFVSGSVYLNYGGSFLTSDPYFIYGPQSGGVLSGSTSVCPSNVDTVLTLGQHHGTIIKWQRSSVPDFSSGVTDIAATAETLTVTQLSETTYYRVVVNTVCGITYSTTATLSVVTTTWNGSSWSNGLPDSSKAVVISAPMVCSADMAACTLTVTGNTAVTVMAGADITVTGSVTVNNGSTLTFLPASNLLQLTDAVNTGNINVQQSSAALFRLDYTLWSSPVTGTQTLQQFSPNTSSSRFYAYNTLTNNYYSVNASTSVFGSGRGYLIRMPNNWVAYNAANPLPSVWTGTFTGVPTNGPVTVNLTNGGSATTRFNAVGNPYPSAIDIADFINVNSAAMEGTVWLWRKTNDQNNPVSYSTCTSAGCTRNNGFTGYTDDSVLEKGQGFIVKLKPGSTSLIFNNGMRRGDNNAQFFRHAEKDRYWLDISSQDTFFTQLLVAHVPGGSSEFDEGLDGIYFNDSPTFLGTIAQDKRLSVEARGEFDVKDTVPLWFSAGTAGEFTISLHNSEGVFDGTQPIYLKDKNTGVTHNLLSGGYRFYTTRGEFSNRFTIVYKLETANNILAKSAKEVVFAALNDNGKLSVTLHGDTIAWVTAYDLTGKEILRAENVGLSTYTSGRMDMQHQVLFVKVMGTSGSSYTKKIVF